VSAFDDVLAANDEYAKEFPWQGVPAPAARGLAVLSCMDSRIDPMRVLGLSVGDFKMMRNAGGRLTTDMRHDIALASHLLNVQRVLLMPHTKCAMASTTDAQISEVVLRDSGIHTAGRSWGTTSDQLGRLKDDVHRLVREPSLKPGTVVAGALYDVDTGRISIVVPEVVAGR
jgi:carbonic anhydrase